MFRNGDEAYTIALDSLMNEEESLNNDIEYISIDMSDVNILKEEYKVIVVNNFKTKYDVEVLDLTLEELREKGLFHPDSKVLSGVLLRIDEIDFDQNSNNAIFKGSKYRSGDGGVTVEGTIQFIDGKWEIKEIKQTSVS